MNAEEINRIWGANSELASENRKLRALLIKQERRIADLERCARGKHDALVGMDTTPVSDSAKLWICLVCGADGIPS